MIGIKYVKKVSIVTSCYNEVSNIEEWYRRVLITIREFNQYCYEIIVIDNDSDDGTIDKLKELALNDSDFKVIINNKNYGHIKSPYWAVLQASGDAIIFLASDLQDPPELIAKFLESWTSGNKIVLGAKPQSETTLIMHLIRTWYYKALSRVSNSTVVSNATGFGLYDKEIIDHIKKINDPYPYFRGLVAELGYHIDVLEFVQPRRKAGSTKNNFYTLYDMAMLGLVSNSMLPLRIASFIGIALGILSLIGGLLLLIIKLIWWDRFAAGLAPIGIVIFFMIGMIFLFIGILGEYIGRILLLVSNKPLVIEAERLNFDGKYN